MDRKNKGLYLEVKVVMAKKLTEKALMKKLNAMDKEELVTLISELFKTKQ